MRNLRLSDSLTSRLEILLLAVWCGAMFITGFLVVPTLFSLLDRTTAGQVAATLFTRVSLIGLVCGAILVLILVSRARITSAEPGRISRARPVVLIAILLLVVAGEFGVSARMRDLREQTPQTAGAMPAFRQLHRVASGLYLLESLGGLFLLLTIPVTRNRSRGQG